MKQDFEYGTGGRRCAKGIAVLLLAAAGIVSPLIAGAAMSLSSLSVALNSHSLDKKLRAPSFDKVCSVPRQPLTGRRRAGACASAAGTAPEML